MERLHNDQEDDCHEKVAQRSMVMRLIVFQGCLAVCIALSTMISVGLAANLPKKEFTPVTPFIISDGLGVWVGLLCILTSAVGWGALYFNGRCLLVTYFSLILVALVFCLLILITCVINAMIMSSYHDLRDTSIYVWRTVMIGLVPFCPSFYPDFCATTGIVVAATEDAVAAIKRKLISSMMEYRSRSYRV
uniref:Uncharacterized protein n=1 Tax=Romanomermis culicivorax TaxID=13658 RepID=A0A915K702_ROMCU